VFLATDGRSPEWAFQSEDRVLLEIAQTRRALADAQAVLAETRTSAAAARQAFELISASRREAWSGASSRVRAPRSTSARPSPAGSTAT
jgi:hypothetical protein